MRPIVLLRLLSIFIISSLLLSWLPFTEGLLTRVTSIYSSSAFATTVEWPEVTDSARPWTRWWWHGSAVDEENLSRLLKEYKAVGLGGVEITCIYGVQDNDDRDREYLSEAWVQALQHTLGEAKRLGLGVDLPAGSGWRMGGPHVTRDDANSRLVLEQKKVAGGETFQTSFQRSTPQAVVAYNRQGKKIVLTSRLSNGQLKWVAPDGDWIVYSLAYRWAGDRVKRPGPGGGGLNINPFSKRAVSNFLQHFGKTLDRIPGVRAQFHDSFEYEGNWQPKFLDEFAKRRGYRLEEHLPALAGEGTDEIVGRVKYDYRKTLADLVLENFIQTWVGWAHDHGQLARNQSHGSPANWLDLYATCDIPEIESFGRLQGGVSDDLILRFAASAANVAGRKLVSSESATWLDEHFNVTLAQIKEIVDRQILAGVNHVFYHGTAYSPADAKWPGWLFYASTQLNPQNPIWHDFSALNTYLTRCQSVLQASQPDNDVLLYWPLADTWHKPEGLRMEIRVHNGGSWLHGRPFGDAAKILRDHGYAFDYVSDRGLATCQPSKHGAILAPGGKYQMVVVPEAKYMTVATLTKLADLSEAGATIVFWRELPQSEPGLAGATKNKTWTAALKRIIQLQSQGRVQVSSDLLTTLEAANLRTEKALLEQNIRFLRKQIEGDTIYFLKNQNKQAFEGWVTLASAATSASILDAVSGKIGLAESRLVEDGQLAVRLQLAAGQSLLVRVSAVGLEANPWTYRTKLGDTMPLAGPWQVDFIKGGPSLPESFETEQPKPWTEAPDSAAENFAGTVRYSVSFDAPNPLGSRCLLDLGEVLSSARVRINGQEIACLFAPPFEIELADLKPLGNRLEVDVTGVAANRIRDLDRRGIPWRIFKDINLVNIKYQKFDATDWPVRPLGLVGPVTITPLSEGPAAVR